MGTLTFATAQTWLRKVAGSAWILIKAAPWFFGTMVVGHFVQENFPFSHWPMYGNFHPQSYYVFVMDEAGNPIASRTFNETTPRIGRQYAFAKKSEIRRSKKNGETETQEKLEEVAGIQMLNRLGLRLSAEQRAGYGGLQLVEVKLSMKGDRKITSEPRTVARVKLDPTAEPATSPATNPVPKEQP